MHALRRGCCQIARWKTEKAGSLGLAVQCSAGREMNSARPGVGRVIQVHFYSYCSGFGLNPDGKQNSYVFGSFCSFFAQCVYQMFRLCR